MDITLKGIGYELIFQPDKGKSEKILEMLQKQGAIKRIEDDIQKISRYATEDVKRGEGIFQGIRYRITKLYKS